MLILTKTFNFFATHDERGPICIKIHQNFKDTLTSLFEILENEKMDGALSDFHDFFEDETLTNEDMIQKITTTLSKDNQFIMSAPSGNTALTIMPDNEFEIQFWTYGNLEFHATSTNQIKSTGE